MTHDDESSPFIPLDETGSNDSDSTGTKTASDDDEELTDFQKKVKASIEKTTHEIALQDYLGEDVIRDLSPPKHDNCSRCDHNNENLKLEVDGYIRYICEDCRNEILEDIDNHHWGDRFQESHYNIISGYLQALDEVWCVKDEGYPGGEMVVHTGYCNGMVVGDILDWFGRIYNIHVKRTGEGSWDCIDEHGDCIEIHIDFAKDVPINPPRPAIFAKILYSSTYTETDYLKDSDELFTRTDEEPKEENNGKVE